MVIRYMGTKRHMAGHVRSALEGLQPAGRVVDLFSGMGSVAESLQDLFPVITNDILNFTAVIARARFTGPTRKANSTDVLNRLEPLFTVQFQALSDLFSDQLAIERIAISNGRQALEGYMTDACHVGNDREMAARANRAAMDRTAGRYCLASLYYSGGYFSMRQSIEIDAIRCAIEFGGRPEEMDWLLAAWLVGLSSVVNAPGHTAQYLKPSSDAGHIRILRSWRRSVWHEFTKALDSLRQIGSEEWRAQNDCMLCDALALVDRRTIERIGAFYADPPYTRDQYSRYYHVYETLFLYDFPGSSGVGRVRSGGTSTSFSRKTTVVASFHDLCRNVARWDIPLVISYPGHGLLNEAGWSLNGIAKTYFSEVKMITTDAIHSTLGASNGSSHKSATENLYVCRP